MNKKDLSERYICTKFVIPAVKQAGWDEMSQIREEVSFTKGRIIIRGKLIARGKAKRADCILYYKPNIPITLIEANDNNQSVGDGMQHGLDYAATLDIPFVFSTNGDGFVFHDRTGSSAEKETNLALDAFPSPTDLWAKYRGWKNLTPDEEQIVLQDYFDDGSGKTPRYYQCNAVNAAIEAIAKGQDRILLVMATGTGKIPREQTGVPKWFDLRWSAARVSRGGIVEAPRAEAGASKVATESAAVYIRRAIKWNFSSAYS